MYIYHLYIAKLKTCKQTNWKYTSEGFRRKTSISRRDRSATLLWAITPTPRSKSPTGRNSGTHVDSVTGPTSLSFIGDGGEMRMERWNRLQRALPITIACINDLLFRVASCFLLFPF